MRGASPGGAARVALAMVWIGLAAALAARLGFGLTGVGEDWAEHHRIMAHALRYEIGLGLAALACLWLAASALRHPGWRWRVVAGSVGMGAAAMLLGRPVFASAGMALAAALIAIVAFAQPVTMRDVRAGALAVGLVLALLVQATAPPLTPLFLWPTLAVALAAAMARAAPSRPWIGALIATAPLAYVLVFAHAVLLALGIPTPEAIGLFASIAAMLVLPLARVRLGWPAATAGMLAIGLLLAFRWTPATERHPTLSQVYAVLDERGRSWRASPLERPDAWTLAALRQEGGTVTRAIMPMIGDDPVWRAATGRIAARPLNIEIARQGELAAITIRPANAGREIRLRLTIDRAGSRASVEGIGLPGFMISPGVWNLRWQSAGEPVTLRFRVAPGTRLGMIAAETSELRLSVPVRPVTVVPWLGSDRTITLRQAAAIF